MSNPAQPAAPGIVADREAEIVEPDFFQNPGRSRILDEAVGVEAAQPANVDTVIIDGRVLKRGGRLTGLPVGEIVGAAERASTGVRRRSGWTWPSQP